MACIVEFRSVTKRYGPGKPAVDTLSFNIPEGSLFGFIGPNGSGKTTSLRMMLRIIYPDSGSIQVLGRGEADADNDHSGYLPEERGLYRRMRVKDVLKFHAQLKSVRQPEARIDYWLERLDLTSRAESRVFSLSKGLAQRVQFAAAVVHDPQLLVLDEPFSGLDPVSLDSLRQVILDLRRSGTTVVLSTHDMHMAERLCDRVVMLHQGQKVLDGVVEDLKRQHGVNSLRIQFTDSIDPISLPGITRTRHYGKEQVLELEPNTDTQHVLEQVLALGRIVAFSVVRPTLHELFVDIAGGPERKPEQGLAEA